MQGRMGNFYWRGLASSSSHGGKEEEFERGVFAFGRSKPFHATAKQHKRNTCIPLSCLSKMEKGRKSQTLHFNKALKVKMMCWLEIYLNEQNPANGTGCRWKWQMGSFKVWFFAWKKILFSISYFSSVCYSVLLSVTASNWQSQLFGRLIYPGSYPQLLKIQSLRELLELLSSHKRVELVQQSAASLLSQEIFARYGLRPQVWSCPRSVC